jgi:hypothetical protein
MQDRTNCTQPWGLAPRQVLRRGVSAFSGAELTNIARALKRRNCKAPGLAAAIRREVEAAAAVGAQRFTPHQLSHLDWALK